MTDLFAVAVLLHSLPRCSMYHQKANSSLWPVSWRHRLTKKKKKRRIFTPKFKILLFVCFLFFNCGTFFWLRSRFIYSPHPFLILLHVCMSCNMQLASGHCKHVNNASLKIPPAEWTPVPPACSWNRASRERVEVGGKRTSDVETRFFLVYDGLMEKEHQWQRPRLIRHASSAPRVTSTSVPKTSGGKNLERHLSGVFHFYLNFIFIFFGIRMKTT